jgi:GTP pyrophosphokinase
VAEAVEKESQAVVEGKAAGGLEAEEYLTANPYYRDYQVLLRRLRRYDPHIDVDLLARAFLFAYSAHREQLRMSGAPYFEHPLEVAKILTELRMDHVTVVAGLLHDVVEDTGISLEEVREEFGDEIAQLVDGVTKIGGLRLEKLETRQAENFRKMLLSMVRDIRVILIKFADRLHNMRTLEYLPEKKRKRIAIETRDVYAPLAHRLGIARIKWELEDLALKELDPAAYEEIQRKIAEKRVERERYIRRFARPIQEELRRAGVRAQITGRPKHFYSIYMKMQKRNLPFEEIYDLLAIRIIVDKVEECYYALGIVHSLYTPVHDRFKDYIATPKSNMYQSLHTTVIGPDGKMVEVQIRTHEMHRTAEEGIAAHWRYKEGKTDEELDKHLVWLRQILEWQQDAHDSGEFLEDLKVELFQDEVFVFTPKGDLLKLPKGATPVDFAFAVHTDIGLHCLAAKVNGRIVPLDYELRSGDRVEIITSHNQKPNPDWLKFVKTSKARSRIKRWLREAQYEQSVQLGQEIVNRFFKRFRIPKDDQELEEIAQSFGLSDVEQLYAAVGRGDLSVENIARKLSPEKIEKAKEDSIFQRFLEKARGSAKGVRVDGVRDMLIHFAKCCQPVPGDRIVGFITRGRGIVVHRADCKNLLAMMEDPNRYIEVEWDVSKDHQFLASLRVLGENRKGLLADISQAIASVDTNIVSAEMKAVDSVASGTFIIEVRNLSHLTRVIHKIRKVRGVLNVSRMEGSVDGEGQEASV